MMLPFRNWLKIALRILAQIGIGANYRLIAVDDEDLADALYEAERTARGSVRSGMSRREALAIVKNPNDEARAFLARFTTAMADAGDPRARILQYANLVPNVLRYSLATLISGTTVTPTFKANYVGLGSGSSAPANSDTALQSESTRAAFSNRSATNNVAYLDAFFPSTVVGGNTYLEAGIFVDGTASANTGYLLSRVAINQVLGSSQTLTLNCSVTVS